MHQDTKGFATDINRGQAIDQGGGQWQGFVTIGQGLAAVSQVLDDDPGLFVIALQGRAFGIMQGHVLAVIQHGHLAQGVVLQFVGLVESRNEYECAGCHGHQHNGQ